MIKTSLSIIGIDGSPVRGNVTALLSEALESAADEARTLGIYDPKTEAVRLAELGMPFHNGSFTDTPDALAPVFEKMRRADAFIFATPVHWYNMSALTKCFIDWLTTLEANFELQGKAAGAIAFCDSDGGNQAVSNILTPLLHMGLAIPPYCAFYRNKFAPVHPDALWQLTDHRLVGLNVVRLALALRSNTRGWSLG